MRAFSPMPPEAFSPLTTTQSGSWVRRSSGSSAASVRRPGAPTTSPTKSSFTAWHCVRRACVRCRHQPTRHADERSSRPATLTKRYGRREALRKVSLTAPARRAGRDHRPERRGQDDPAVDPGRRSRSPTRARSATRPKEIGWVPQQAALYSKLTVRENLKLFARLERCPDVGERGRRMLDQTRLRDRADDQVGVLSGGNRQRVNIAIGLLAEPRGAAARRAERGARPAPARAPLGVHRRAGGQPARRSSTRPTTSTRPTATRTRSSCWPTASGCSRARRASSSGWSTRPPASRPRASRRRSSPSSRQRGH